MRMKSLIPVIMLIFLSPVYGFASVAEEDAPLFSASQYLAANYASKNHHLETAAELFSNILQYSDQDPELLDKSYRSYLYSGNFKNALIYAKRVVEINPDDNLAKLLLAVEGLHQKNYVQSKQYLTSQSNTSVEEAAFPYLLLWVSAGEGRYDEAIAQAEKMVELEKNNQPFLYFQVALLADLAQNYDKAREYYNKGLDSNYRSYSYVRAAANFYEREGNQKRALAIYKEFQTLHPNMGYFGEDIRRVQYGSLATKRVIQDAAEGAAEILAEIGRMLFGVEAYLQSVAYLQMVLYLAPMHHDSIILLSAYYGDIKQYEKAIQLYRQLRLGNDLYYPSRVYLAEHLYNSGQKSLAIRQLLTLGKYRSIRHFALITLADLLRKDKNFSAAVHIYNQVIDAIESPTASDWILFFARGVSYERLKDWQNAKKDLETALILQPNQPEVLNYLGYSYLEQNINLKNAKQMIHKAIKQRPEDPQVIDSMGWAFYLLKEYDKALEYLERAVEIAPQDMIINDHLGDVYWSIGRKREAKFQWKKALKYHIDETDVVHIKDKIQRGL